MPFSNPQKAVSQKCFNIDKFCMDTKKMQENKYPTEVRMSLLIMFINRSILNFFIGLNDFTLYTPRRLHLFEDIGEMRLSITLFQPASQGLPKMDDTK
jgi:hypothetical protein